MEPSSMYEVEDSVKFRVERREDGKEYEYYLVKVPDVWIKKVARDLGVNPKELRLKMCFNEISGLLIVPLKPKNNAKNSPKPVTDPELRAKLEGNQK